MHDRVSSGSVSAERGSAAREPRGGAGGDREGPQEGLQEGGARREPQAGCAGGAGSLRGVQEGGARRGEVLLAVGGCMGSPWGILR